MRVCVRSREGRVSHKVYIMYKSSENAPHEPIPQVSISNMNQSMNGNEWGWKMSLCCLWLESEGNARKSILLSVIYICVCTCAPVQATMQNMTEYKNTQMAAYLQTHRSTNGLQLLQFLTVIVIFDETERVDIYVTISNTGSSTSWHIIAVCKEGLCFMLYLCYMFNYVKGIVQNF